MYKNKYIKYKKKYLDLKNKIDKNSISYGGDGLEILNPYDNKDEYDKRGLINLQVFPGETGDIYNFPTESYRFKNKDLVSLLRNFREISYPMILPGNNIDTLKMVGPLDLDYKNKFDTVNYNKESREFEKIRYYITNKKFPLITKVFGTCTYKDATNKIINGTLTSATDKELGKKSTFKSLGRIDLDKELVYIGCRNKENKLHGPGVLIVKRENKIYEGRFKNNFPDNVRIYKGASFDDVLSKYKIGSNYSYVGGVSNTRIENMKIEVLKNSLQFDWDYYGMTEHGIGIQYEFEDKISNEPIYEGGFEFGLRHGRGIDYVDWNISRFNASTPNIPADLISEPKNIFFSTPNEADGSLTLPSASNYYNYKNGKQCANDNREYINFSIDGNPYQTCRELETLYDDYPDLKPMPLMPPIPPIPPAIILKPEATKIQSSAAKIQSSAAKIQSSIKNNSMFLYLNNMFKKTIPENTTPVAATNPLTPPIAGTNPVVKIVPLAASPVAATNPLTPPIAGTNPVGTAKPVAAINPLTSPIAGTNPVVKIMPLATKSVAAINPLTPPIAGINPVGTTKPVAGTNPVGTTKPVAGTNPVVKIIPLAASPVAVAKTAPTTNPVIKTVPVVNPAAKTVPVVNPAVKTIPNVSPVAKTIPNVSPVAKTIPTTKPVAKTIPTPKPVIKIIPTTKPVAKTIPTPKPVIKIIPKTSPVSPTTKPVAKPTKSSSLTSMFKKTAVSPKTSPVSPKTSPVSPKTSPVVKNPSPKSLPSLSGMFKKSKKMKYIIKNNY